MLFNNPFKPERIDGLLDELWLTNSSKILDVGCGEGELILRLLQRFNCFAVGVDVDETAVKIAQQKVAKYAQKATFHTKSFAEVTFPNNHFDASFSLGATHAFGEVGEALDNALASLKVITKPSGLIIIGDGYWRKEPDPAYLQMTGIDKKELRAHHENIAAGEKIGLECIYAITASHEEWDHFEGAFWMAAERERLQQPEDPQIAEKVNRRRKWKNAYWQWGQNTMGFGLYVFLVAN
ncbi:class I SAM-dependent methyltransferase [Candidatus Leptofilum sp.]|uniref:class I SAM-dependent methyltransferase n=1 Tax=Candidatus Leptofilum sp. TaxID=3241576 RepID=UPI003B5CBC79